MPHAQQSKLTANHKRYERAVRDNCRSGVVIGVGPAGTGKTQIACAAAADHLISKSVRRIVVTRPAVATEGEYHGYLPGGIDSKMMPYVRPMLDAFVEHGIDRSKVSRLVADGVIEICPLAFMRGRTFSDCYVIVDEAQNSTPEQMRMLLTRAGERCKVVVTGDLTQSDLAAAPRGGRDPPNGLHDLLVRVSASYADGADELPVDIVWFEEGDVLRSSLARKMVSIYA